MTPAVPRMPIPKNPLPRGVNRSVDDLVTLYRRPHEEQLAAGRRYPGDYVMGFRLPDWQRPLVWTEAQMRAFIESAWLGFDLGQIVATRYFSSDVGRGLDPLDNLLIDGQQRLSAMTRYLAGELEVFGARFPDLDGHDLNHFMGNVTLGVVFLNERESEDVLRARYVAMNFGGTAHAAEHHPDAGWRRTARGTP